MNFIIYGAGRMGMACLEFLKKYNLNDEIACFCDSNAKEIIRVEDKEVVSYDQSKEMNLPYIVAVKRELSGEIIDRLKQDNKRCYEGLDKLIVDELHLMDRTSFEREFCAVSHINTMDDYFNVADSDAGLNLFWDNESVFYDLFKKLDLEAVVELACGRGRHVPRYIEKAGQITLVDILEKNIEACKTRFGCDDKIQYVVNNGYDLSDLKTGSFTALFTYDAMVHFELIDIANYLNETYRILKPGGMALFHHSNNYSDYKASYADAIESRSFMSDRIFAYLAYRAGLEVVEQRVIDWNGYPGLDCLTLVVKN